MKPILLWDPRFPQYQPQRYVFPDALASAAVRAGVAAPADPADAGVLAIGGPLSPADLVEVLIEQGNFRTMTRVILPLSVVLIGAGLGLLTAIGAIIGAVAPDPQLGTLSLSGSLKSGIASSGEIMGATAGSTITSNVPGLTVNSAARTYSFTGSTPGDVADGLVETLGSASNSPKSSPITVTFVADSRRTNESVTYGYGALTRNGFGAVPFNSDFLGVTRPGREKPVSYAIANPHVGSAAHWTLSTTTTNTPTKKAALTDPIYAFFVTAIFADGSSERITLTIERLTDVYTVGQTDNLLTVGVTDTATISGKTVEFAAGVNFRVAGVPGRKFIPAWRPAQRVTLRPHDTSRMGFPPCWQYQSCQNVTFDKLWTSGDLNPQGLSAAHVWTRASNDTNNNGAPGAGLIHTNQRIVYDKAWYSSPDAGTLSYFLKTSGTALEVGTTVIPVLGGTAVYSGNTLNNAQAMANRGVNPGDRLVFPNDTTIYTVLEDNITYATSSVISGSIPYPTGGSFKITPGLQVAIAAGATNITAIPTPNAYSPEYCDDVTIINPVVENVRGIVSSGLNPNTKFEVIGMECRHYYDNVIITGTLPPQGIRFADCVWMDPDRISKYLHVDAIQVAYAASKGVIRIERCMSIQGAGTALIQGLFQRGDGTLGASGPAQAADGSDSSTFIVDGYIITTAAVSAMNMSGGQNLDIKRVMGVPAIGGSKRNDLDPFFGNAMAANFTKVDLKDGSPLQERFYGTNKIDRVVLFSDLNNEISPAKLTVTNTIAHGGKLFASSEAAFGSPNYAKVKTSAGYVSGGYYDADPVEALAAIPYASLSFADAVAATKNALRPKLNGAYKLADGSYMTALNPDGSWATDAAYAG